MGRIVVINWEYLEKLRRNFEVVKRDLRLNTYPPVQKAIKDYIRKCEDMIGRAEELIGDQLIFPDVLYHHTASDKSQRIAAEGVRMSTDPSVKRVWEKAGKSLVPGVYLTRHVDHDRGREGYERRIEIRTDEMDIKRLMFDEDNVFRTPLHSLLNVNGTVAYLGAIPREWVLGSEENESAAA